MAKTKSPTVIYVVGTKAPEGVFFQQDVAQRSANKGSREGQTGSASPELRVFALQVTTKTEFDKGVRADALAALSPEARLALGLGPKKARKKKDTIIVQAA